MRYFAHRPFTHLDETGDGNNLWLIMAGKKCLDKFSSVKNKGRLFFFFPNSFGFYF